MCKPKKNFIALCCYGNKSVFLDLKGGHDLTNHLLPFVKTCLTFSPTEPQLVTVIQESHSEINSV